MKFGNTYSVANKVKGHFAVGYLRDDQTLEIHYRGVKCDISVKNVVDHEVELTSVEFEEKLINTYKETKKLLKIKGGKV
jgi:hypothetical protein